MMPVQFPFRPSAAASCSRLISLVAFVAVLMLTMRASEAAASGIDDSLHSHLSALAATLPEPAQQALESIEGSERKLLAARSYARAGAELVTRWSWTSLQIRQFEASAEYERLLAQVRMVSNRFEAQNPGYSLYANMQVRTLELQLARWHENPRVGTTAEELRRAVTRELRSHDYPLRATSQSVERFRQFLLRWYPSMPAPLAAPGLSAHGQLRAVDFQVTKGAEVVAGPSIATVRDAWEHSGWRNRLSEAVRSAGVSFIGPLAAPNEPWHYVYNAAN